MKKIILTKIFQVVFCACCLFIFSNDVSAQGQFGIYQFNGTSTGNGQFNNVTAQPAFGTFSTFTRTGCTWLTGYANAWASESWPAALNAGFYHQFTFTPNAGVSISITSITFNGWRNSTAGTFTLRSSQDGYAANISGPFAMTTTA